MIPSVQKLIVGLLISGERISRFEQACFDQIYKLPMVDYVLWFSPSQIDKIKHQNLDVLFQFGRWQDPVADTGASIFVFNFGDFESCQNFGLREVAFGHLVQEFQLLKLDPTSPHLAQVIRQGRMKTNFRSLYLHRQAVLDHVSFWPASILRAAHGETHDYASLKLKIRPGRSWLLRSLATVLLPFRIVWSHVHEFAARLRRAVTYQKWNVGVIQAPIERLLEPGFKPRIQWFPAPKWPHSVADPFPVKVSGRSYLLAEVFNFTADRGHIAAMEVTDHGELVESSQSLKFPFHMSYPCLLQHGEEVYCLPEALEAKGLTIYKAGRFPNLWFEHSRVIEEGAFADPTLFRFEGRWWVMATKFDLSSHGNSTLYAWWTEDLSAPWTPHVQNPLKIDVTSSRSAGTPFVHLGRLYRPAQNCARQYGGSVVMNVVRVLNPFEFKEVAVQELRPDRNYPSAFHHVSQFGELTYVDGRRDHFFPRAALSKLSKFFKTATLPNKFKTEPLSRAVEPALLRHKLAVVQEDFLK